MFQYFRDEERRRELRLLKVKVECDSPVTEDC